MARKDLDLDIPRLCRAMQRSRQIMEPYRRFQVEAVKQ